MHVDDATGRYFLVHTCDSHQPSPQPKSTTSGGGGGGGLGCSRFFFCVATFDLRMLLDSRRCRGVNGA
jgi:hypothetical protein